MDEIIGVAFPIPMSYIPRFFDQGKTVFIKPACTFRKIKSGIKFFFYQSQKDAGYVGEAIIRNIAISDDPFSFFDLYGDKVFLTRKELSNYIEVNKKWNEINSKRAKKPRTKKWIAIELSSALKYDTVIKTKKFVPISGKYISRNLIIE